MIGLYFDIHWINHQFQVVVHRSYLKQGGNGSIQESKDLCNIAQMVQLWTNYACTDLRQIGSNLDEMCHSFKRELVGILHKFGHRFCGLFKVIFI